MSENGGYAVYMMYQSLRLHFISDSYDYFKYNGKTNTTKESFLTHKNKYSFYKLSRKYSLEDCRDFLVSNFVRQDFHWVGELLTPEAEDNYTNWLKTKQSLTYTFENDITYLFDHHKDFISVKSASPKLYDELLRHKVTLETVVILNDLMNFLPMWEKKIDDDIIWPTWKRKIRKYTPFVVYDKIKFRDIVRKYL